MKSKLIHLVAFLIVLCFAGCMSKSSLPSRNSAEDIFSDNKKFHVLHYDEKYQGNYVSMKFYIFDVDDINDLNKTLINKQFDLKDNDTSGFGLNGVKPPSWWEPNRQLGINMLTYRFRSMRGDDLDYDIFLYKTNKSHEFFVVQVSY